MNEPLTRNGWRLAAVVFALLFVLQTVRLNSLRHRVSAEGANDNVKTAVTKPGAAVAGSPRTGSAGGDVSARQARIGRAASSFKPSPTVPGSRRPAGTETGLGGAEPAAAFDTGTAPDAAAPAGDAHVTAASEATRGREAAAAETRRQEAATKLLNQARGSVNKGDYDTAVETLNTVLEQDPANVTALQMMASICHNLGLRDDERFYYESWAAAQPGATMPYYNLARLLSEQGLRDQARTAAARYEELSKGNGAAAASLYRQLNMTAEEGRVLQAWATTAPKSVEAHRWLADYYQRSGNQQAAAAEYQQIVANAPGDVEAHLSLASVYQNLQQTARAQAEITAAVTLRPGDMMLRLRLADSYRQGGNLAVAMTEYQGIVNYAPQSAAGKAAAQQLNALRRQAAQTPR